METEAEAPPQGPGPAPSQAPEPTARRPDHSFAKSESEASKPPRRDDLDAAGATPIPRERRTSKGLPRYVWVLGALA